jgi:hypothetical protein
VTLTFGFSSVSAFDQLNLKDVPVRQSNSEGSHLADDRQISDDRILTIEREFAVQWGVFEVLFPSLSEVQVWDLTDAQERAVLRVNVFIHHALFSAKENVTSLCKDDILKIRVITFFPRFQ